MRKVLALLAWTLGALAARMPADAHADAALTAGTELRGCAEQGDAFAHDTLGVASATDQGTPPDGGQVVAWYRKAAEEGHAWAQFHLGLMYEYGQGVPKDYVEAYTWMSLAAERAKGKDRERYADGLRALSSWMTPEQRDEARKRAQEWTAAFVLRRKR
jgi:uncharacterized protein